MVKWQVPHLSLPHRNPRTLYMAFPLTSWGRLSQWTRWNFIWHTEFWTRGLPMSCPSPWLLATFIILHQHFTWECISKTKARWTVAGNKNKKNFIYFLNYPIFKIFSICMHQYYFELSDKTNIAWIQNSHLNDPIIICILLNLALFVWKVPFHQTLNI